MAPHSTILRVVLKASILLLGTCSGGIRNTPQNAGETASFCEGGAESGALDIQSDANWSEIRELIARCEELPGDVRERLVAMGDECQADRIGG